MALSRKKPDQFKLCRVGILIFIHHDIPEAILIILEDIGACLEQLYCLHDQIVEINSVILFECCLIFLIKLCDLLLTVIPSGT